MNSQHTFFIPVMGTAFTADSPLKVAHYGINTVIALADDVLLERLRKYYSELYNIYYLLIIQTYLGMRCTRISHASRVFNVGSRIRLQQKYREHPL